MGERWRATASAACVAFGMFAGPAVADSNLGSVGGLTYIQDSVTVGAAPADAKVTADCPPGVNLVGGGATPAASPFSESWINTLVPVDRTDPRTGPDGVKGRITNLAGASKGFSTYAICAATDVGVASNRTRLAANRGDSLRAACPAGMRVASGGGSLSGPASQSFINSSHPFDDADQNSRPDDGWRARAFNDSAGRPRLRVIALCIEAPLTYTSYEAGPGLSFAPCPAGGHVVGGGIDADGPADAGHLNTAYPYADPSNPPDRGLVLAMGSTSGDGPGYTAHVICTGP